MPACEGEGGQAHLEKRKKIIFARRFPAQFIYVPAKWGITLVLDVLELRVDHVAAHRGDRLAPRTWKEDMSSILLDQAYTLERITKWGMGEME